MKTVLQLVDEGDFVALGVAIVILCFVGAKMVGDKSAARTWGLRLAAVGFVAYFIYGCIKFRADDAGTLSSVAFRGLFAAGLVLGASWLVLPIIAFIYQRTVGVLLRGLGDAWQAGRKRAVARKAKRQEQRSQREAERDYQRQSPERERALREAEVRAEADGRARRRKEDARASCELLYASYAAEIGQRFSKDMFDDFVKKHLGDERDAEYVEQRAEQLQAVLRQHHENVRPVPKFKDMVELAAWFQAQKKEIEGLPIDDRAKRTHLANLNRRFQELMSEHLEHSGP